MYSEINDLSQQNYELQQGKHILNSTHKNKLTGSNNVIGLEGGSLQSHETVSQINQNDSNNLKNKTLDYGRLLTDNKKKIVSASNLQGKSHLNFFNFFNKSEPHIDSYKDGEKYSKFNIEGLTGIEGLSVSANNSLPSDQVDRLKNLENKFNGILSTYITTYKTMYEDMLSRKKKLKGVSDFTGKAVTDSDNNYYYVNDHGYTHKYSPEAWTKNDESCPGKLVNIDRSDLNKLSQSVDMNIGQPCKIAGRNVQNKDSGEVAWVDIQGKKHVYSDTVWKSKKKSCDVKPIVLTSEKYDLIPTGNNMVSTSICDTLGVDPNVLQQLETLNSELIDVSKEMQDEISTLRTQDQNINNELNQQKEVLNGYIKTLEKNKKTIQNNKSIDMNSITGSYEMSILDRRQKQYRYLAWSLVAVTVSMLVVREAAKGRS